tara:strand:- start:740 stop:889 length:150 start_codon:yes stop_codon:yes gene_type:complete
MKLSLPKYVTKLIKKFPDIASGRKNYKEHHIRIMKNLYLVKKYIKNSKS